MPSRRLNCLYYCVDTGRWLPSAAMHELRRASPAVFLARRVTQDAEWNLVNTREKTCTCDHYFFTSISEPAETVVCRHLRLLLLALGRLDSTLPAVRPHAPSRRTPLTSDQHRLLLDWLAASGPGG